MIERDITKELLQQLQEFPVVTILGPRQAGKTTLVKKVLTGYSYVSLEDPETRERALTDPKGFLREYDNKVIFDEVQRVPQLLSYIQGIVDEKNSAGQYVLTGSHQLELHAAITQSLAGRTGLLTLLPLSISELSAANIKHKNFAEYIYQGFLPRIYDKKQRPKTAYAAYYRTYVERDVRQIIQLKDSALFEKFLKLIAGRAGQVINFQSLSNDVGVDAKTIKHWLSILEASFIVVRLQPYFENFGKRVIKSPKLYFIDTGLLAYLLDISDSGQIERDPLVGAMFENLVVMEAFKHLYNQGESPNVYFYRDSTGNEVDLIYKRGNQLTAVEIKSASTFSNSYKKGLKRLAETSNQVSQSFVVYTGKKMQFSDGVEVLNFTETSKLFLTKEL